MADSPLVQLFGRSPFKPLQQHVTVCREAAEFLAPFFTAVFVQDWQGANQVRQDICQKEDEADRQKRDIRLHLPGSLFLPVARTDLLELVTMQDQIANVTKEISGIVIGRELVIPDEVQSLFKDYLESAIVTCRQADKTIHELDELIETGFKGNEVDLVNRMIEELDRLEHANDELEILLRRTLRPLENSYSPIDMMFLYNVIDQIGLLADVALKVGSRLSIMLAR